MFGKLFFLIIIIIIFNFLSVFQLYVEEETSSEHDAANPCQNKDFFFFFYSKNILRCILHFGQNISCVVTCADIGIPPPNPPIWNIPQMSWGHNVLYWNTTVFVAEGVEFISVKCPLTTLHMHARCLLASDDGVLLLFLTPPAFDWCSASSSD